MDKVVTIGIEIVGLEQGLTEQSTLYLERSTIFCPVKFATENIGLVLHFMP